MPIFPNHIHAANWGSYRISHILTKTMPVDTTVGIEACSITVENIFVSGKQQLLAIRNEIC